MTEKELKELNDELTEMTGIKHFASVGDMLENKFSQLGYKDDNGNKIEVQNNDGRENCTKTYFR